MTDATELKALYDAIPGFQCRPGCSDCCGPVPFAPVEWKRIKLAKTGIACDSCLYLVDSKCSIYRDRPFLCRLFGATEDAKMACPHGCGPEHPLNQRQTDILMSRYLKLVGNGTAYLTGPIDIS